MNVPVDQLITDLKQFIRPFYPDMDIQAVPWDQDPSRLAIYFREARFVPLYPYQRWHALTHLIPEDYQNEALESAVWFELAPGERPEDLQFPDEDLIDSITPAVMKCLVQSRFFDLLDDAICPQDSQQERVRCCGDFRQSRPLLLRRGFTENELFDVFHVLMRQGGFCDCEILYNAVEQSRLKSEYWTARTEEIEPYDPHTGSSQDRSCKDPGGAMRNS